MLSHFNYGNAFEERYLQHDLRVNYNMNNFIQLYKKLVDYFEEALGASQLTFYTE